MGSPKLQKEVGHLQQEIAQLQVELTQMDTKFDSRLKELRDGVQTRLSLSCRAYLSSS